MLRFVVYSVGCFILAALQFGAVRANKSQLLWRDTGVETGFHIVGGVVCSLLGIGFLILALTEGS